MNSAMGPPLLAAHMDFALEDEDHPVGGRAFFKENIAGLPATTLRRGAPATGGLPERRPCSGAMRSRASAMFQRA